MDFNIDNGASEGCHLWLSAAVKPRPDSRRGMGYVVQEPKTAAAQGTGVFAVMNPNGTSTLAAWRSPGG